MTQERAIAAGDIRCDKDLAQMRTRMSTSPDD